MGSNEHYARKAQEALLRACPTRRALEQFAWARLEVVLDHVASDADLTTATRELILHVESKGEFKRLRDGLEEEFSNNSVVREFLAWSLLEHRTEIDREGELSRPVSVDHPVLLLGYDGKDDRGENGFIRKMGVRLEQKIRTLTGDDDFTLFQDIKQFKEAGIGNWSQAVLSRHDLKLFYIPVVTPRFCRNGLCRGQLQAFLEREKTLERDDLILPIYYAGLDGYSGEVPDEVDALVDRVIIDLRDLRARGLGLSSTSAQRALHQLAERIKHALREGRPTALHSPIPTESSQPPLRTGRTRRGNGALNQSESNGPEVTERVLSTSEIRSLTTEVLKRIKSLQQVRKATTVYAKQAQGTALVVLGLRDVSELLDSSFSNLEDHGFRYLKDEMMEQLGRLVSEVEQCSQTHSKLNRDCLDRCTLAHNQFFKAIDKVIPRVTVAEPALRRSGLALVAVWPDMGEIFLPYFRP